MNTYIALFREINVGGKHLLPMKDLVATLITLGFEGIRTYIQSGNVVLKSKRKCSVKEGGSIASAVEARVGFRPEVLLLDAPEFKEAIVHNPYDTTIGKALHFFFLKSMPLAPDLPRLESLRSPSEQFTLNGKVLYLSAPDGIGRSKLGAAVERSMGTTVTARNWNTVSKLLEMIEEPS
jgi:uncharacterized protein (DUF1697 family)